MLRENFLFEISWEVCNKVGGIHTVITSKISQIKKYYKNYFLVGPYLNMHKNSNSEFSEIEVPNNFIKSYNELLEIGIKLHFGEWKNYENQAVILVEYLDYSNNINEIKKTLWEKYNIDSLGSNWYDFDEAILWSWCCGIAIEKLSKNNSENVLVHAHEWMSGGDIFYLKQLKKETSKFKTIFTTHATMLGRSTASNDSNLYEKIVNSNSKFEFDSNTLSHKMGVHTKHQTEKALANFADCFTTVSQITNLEAKQFYNKEADVLLPNGFNGNINLKNEEIINDFKSSRDYLNNFLKSYSNNFYDIDLDESLIFSTSGRNEFRNKGLDLYINSLGKLNRKLKLNENAKNQDNFEQINNYQESTLKNQNFSKSSVINLFLIPIGDFEKDEQVLNSIENFEKVQNSQNSTMKNLSDTQIQQVKFVNRSFSKSSINDFNLGKQNRISESNILPFSTNKVPTKNDIIKAFLEAELYNKKEDKVKVILLPFYLNEQDDFLKKDYYEIIKGCDLNIFPSEYEPWGYTPMESISFAVPTVTTDFTGFGIYCKENFDEHKGVEILKRVDKTFEESADELYEILLNFSKKTDEEIESIKFSSFNLSKNFNWSVFIGNYLKAYLIAEIK